MIDQIKQKLPALRKQMEAKTNELASLQRRARLFEFLIASEEGRATFPLGIHLGRIPNGPWHWTAHFWTFEDVVHGWGETQQAAIESLYHRLENLTSGGDE